MMDVCNFNVSAVRQNTRDLLSSPFFARPFEARPRRENSEAINKFFMLQRKNNKNSRARAHALAVAAVF
jgi:hypothetical protein